MKMIMPITMSTAHPCAVLWSAFFPPVDGLLGLVPPDKFSPQCLHLTATDRISSPQNGQALFFPWCVELRWGEEEMLLLKELGDRVNVLRLCITIFFFEPAGDASGSGSGSCRDWLQAGHSTTWPSKSSGTSSGCWQLGQVIVMSLIFHLLLQNACLTLPSDEPG